MIVSCSLCTSCRGFTSVPVSERKTNLSFALTSATWLWFGCRPMELIAAACGSQIYIWSLRGKANGLQVMPRLKSIAKDGCAVIVINFIIIIAWSISGCCTRGQARHTKDRHAMPMEIRTGMRWVMYAKSDKQDALLAFPVVAMLPKHQRQKAYTFSTTM